MISAGCGHDSGGRHVASEQVREGATTLERPGTLQQFELERDRLAGQAEIAASTSIAGVRRMCGAMTRCTRSMAARSIAVLIREDVPVRRDARRARARPCGRRGRVFTSSVSDSSSVNDPCLRVIVIS